MRSDLCFQLAVLGNIFAAGHHHLHEGEFPVQLGITIEQVAKCGQPLRNAFGVVEPINAQDDAAAVETVSDLGGPLR